MNFTLAADKVLGSGDFTVMQEISRYHQEKTFNTIYKILISFASPKTTLNRAASIWKQYHDTGRMEVKWLGDTHANLLLLEYPDIPMHHEQETTPAIEKIMVMAGAKNCQLDHTQCQARGDEKCVWDISYE